MGKPDQVSAAAEEARRATGGAAGRGRGGRFSARRKRETVLRLLRGEDPESVSRDLGVTAARASQWRDQFLVAGQAGLKSRATEAVDRSRRRGVTHRRGAPSVAVSGQPRPGHPRRLIAFIPPSHATAAGTSSYQPSAARPRTPVSTPPCFGLSRRWASTPSSTCMAPLCATVRP